MSKQADPIADAEKPAAPVMPKERARVRIAAPTNAPRLRTREELSALALDVYQLALDCVFAYRDRNGVEKSYPKPDFSSALKALEVMAGLAGYDKEAPERALKAEDVGDAEAALDRIRSNIARRAVVGKEEK